MSVKEFRGLAWRGYRKAICLKEQSGIIVSIYFFLFYIFDHVGWGYSLICLWKMCGNVCKTHSQ